ncbi:MAG: hypothetical protein ACOYK6_02445 [Chthoniobacterales bacterium]
MQKNLPTYRPSYFLALPHDFSRDDKTKGAMHLIITFTGVVTNFFTCSNHHLTSLI